MPKSILAIGLRWLEIVNAQRVGLVFSFYSRESISLPQKGKFMKQAQFVVLGLMMVFGALAHAADTIRTTTTGAVFTRDESVPALGEAWRDERGVIWGDAAKNADGSINKGMNQYDAEKYCESIGARLPTRDDFVSLRKAMGSTNPDSIWDEAGYTAQVLPNLNVDFLYFWSSWVDADYAYVFIGSNSLFGFVPRNNYDVAVRCVR
jgi:hypothetical protein